MEKQQDLINYARIAKAIAYLREHALAKPSLEALAEHVHLSPFHFQRLFKEWAGISPKQFMQYISINHAKSLLAEQQQTLFSTSMELGMSSSSRLHDLFISIEGMSPAAYKNAGKDLNIAYSFQPSPFGLALIASTDKGICHLSFLTEQDAAPIAQLQTQYPLATLLEQEQALHRRAMALFQEQQETPAPLKLHLPGTAFQLKVWEALLRIPTGALNSYAQLAEAIGKPQAARAVGTAIGKNPIAFLIPCHRVIQRSGVIGDYRWGTDRKTALIAWESAHLNPTDDVSF